MKRFINLFLVLSIIFVGTTCGSITDDDDDDNQDQLTLLQLLSDSDSNFFYTAIKEVAPTIEEGTSRTSQRALESGSIMYDIYSLLRDYEYPTHEGIVDMHNIYKVIHTAGQIYSTAESSCEDISATTINSPYDLGLSETYDCVGNSDTMEDNYANGFAIKESDETKYSLLTYRWAPEAPDHTEHGILQGSYNDDTGELSIRMIHHVYYASMEGFVVRSHIDGNEDTHEFTIKIISTGTGSTPSWISIVGKGVSEGDENYFLFKVMNNTYDEPSSARYFCISATATDTTFEEIHTSTPNGSDSVASDCSTYASDVNDMTFLDKDTDVPTTLNDFTDSSILLSF